MQITVELLAQLRHVGRTDSLQLELEPKSCLSKAMIALAMQLEESLRSVLFIDSQAVRPSVIVLVNGEVASVAENRQLADGDVITLITPIGGG